MKNIFEPSDFNMYTESGVYMGHISPKNAANIANAKVKEWLEREGKVVYICDRDMKTIHFAEPVEVTHKGVLINVEPIEQKKCEHDDFVKSYKITRDIGIVPYEYICGKCKKTLKPTGWVEV